MFLCDLQISMGAATQSRLINEFPGRRPVRKTLKTRSCRLDMRLRFNALLKKPLNFRLGFFTWSCGYIECYFPDNGSLSCFKRTLSVSKSTLFFLPGLPL